MNVVGLAKNGKEAIELYDKYMPDIVITDIKMPIIDGLELLKILKSKRKDLITIILSHYDDFSYVKEALSNGATDYILKSELSPENLIEVLKKHLVELKPAEPDAHREIRDDEQLLNKALHYIYQGCHFQNSDDQPGMLLALLKQQLIERQYLFLFVSLFFSERQSEKTDTILRSTESILRNKLPKYSLRMYFPSDNIICILLDAGLQNGPINPLTVTRNIQSTLQQFLNLEARIGTSDISFEPTDIQIRFNEAMRRNQDAFFSSKHIAMETQNCEPGEASPIASYYALRSLFENAEKTEIQTTLADYYNRLYLQGDLALVKKFYNNLRAAIKYLTVKHRKTSKGQLHDIAIIEMKSFESLCSFDHLKQYVEYCCDLFFKCRNEDTLRPLSPNIHSCLQFIHNNYYRNISLTDAAQHTNTSKSYLSTLFKQEKGIRFSAYLNNYRLDKAKELLASTNHLIYEVAEMVGFDNPYYFSKLFKDTFHISCKEYRRNHFTSEGSDPPTFTGKESV